MSANDKATNESVMLNLPVSRVREMARFLSKIAKTMPNDDIVELEIEKILSGCFVTIGDQVKLIPKYK